MDRRRFLGCSCSFLACSNQAPAAHAAPPPGKGCRRGATAGLVDGDHRPASGQPFYDMFCRQWHRTLIADFGVRPGFSFFDDVGAPNAYAQPEPSSPDGPDGAILLGIDLMKLEIGAFAERAVAKIAVIIAHEFGHICQFKRSITGPWQVELHADYLAGWALAQQLSRISPPPPSAGAMPTLPPILSVFLSVFGNQSAVQTMFEKGDTFFEDPDHHGTPKQRAAMVTAGYGAKELDLSAAFERGLIVSGVRTG